MSEHSELWWVSVGGNPCEPARVTGTPDEHREVYTIGCGDPTILSNDCGIELVKIIENIPLSPPERAAQVAAWEARRKADAKRGIYHGYRRFA